MKRRAEAMEVDHEELGSASRRAFDPWREQAELRLKGIRRAASPMRASIGTPPGIGTWTAAPAPSPPPARQPRGSMMNANSGQTGGFIPSSMDPRVFRLPYTLVSDKDVTMKKFTANEEDHEPFIKWVEGIKKFVENRVTHQGELDRIMKALEWAETEKDVIPKEKMGRFLREIGVSGNRMDAQIKELLLVQTEGRAHALVDRAFGGLDAWWRLKDRFLIRDAQKVSLRYQEFYNIKGVNKIGDVPGFLDEVDEKVMKIEEAEGGRYRFEEQHKLGQLKTCLPHNYWRTWCR